MIDFGLAKKFVKRDSEEHISFKENKGSGTGTARYMSINSHLGHSQSRRDDMESFGYMLIHLMQGKLPWQGLKSKSKEEHMQKIYEMKRSFSIKKLCKNCPMEFRRIMLPYFLHVRNLGFEETPDYDYLRKLFSDVYKIKGYKNDEEFDWNF